MKNSILFILITFNYLLIHTQETIISDGFFQMELPSNFDKIRLEKECIQNARLDAIEKAFGSVLSQKNTNTLSNNSSNGEVKTEQMFSSVGFSYLSGKWISDIQAPKIEYFKYKKTDWISVTVTGNVKQLPIEEISKNPTSPNDFLALAFSLKNSGNERKSIEYLEKYFEISNDNFFEPNQLYLDLMDSEDRMEEAIKFYTDKLEKDSSIFNQILLKLALKDELTIIDISNNHPNSILGKILKIKILIKNNLILNNITFDTYCEKLDMAEGLNEFINSKYYKSSNEFLSKNTAKNIFTDIEKTTLRNLAKIRLDYIKDKINELIVKSKQNYTSKDEIMNDVIQNLKLDYLFKCSSQETLIKVFNNFYKG